MILLAVQRLPCNPQVDSALANYRIKKVLLPSRQRQRNVLITDPRESQPSSRHRPRVWSILLPMESHEMPSSCRCSGDVHLIFALALILVTAPYLDAQWLKPPTPGAPRTADGKVDLRGPAPRTSDDKPDLSGMWLSSAKFNTNLAADFKG